ncbi:MAG: hypothetical protein KME45_31745 [Stenomitos rutilans HA7619-LM2]|jgi:hypothetical protein|nr:hypothetical protein [Stenomitos rutilans HA7619-LM2]
MKFFARAVIAGGKKESKELLGMRLTHLVLEYAISGGYAKNPFMQWWQVNGSAWTEQLRAIIEQYRNDGDSWQFNDAQKEQLQQYYDANKLLLDCLNGDCYVSRDVREEIKTSLLLPIAESEEKFPNQQQP